jgi:hypothetical protein
VAGLPVRLLDDPVAVADGEAVFWLGSAADGAAYLRQLRQAQPQAILVLGPVGEDPVFAERAGDLNFVYWTAWLDAGYTDWITNHAAASPNAYLIYRATLSALAAATGVTLETSPASWSVQVFRFDAQGAWSPLLP